MVLDVILERAFYDDGTVGFVAVDGNYELTSIHQLNEDCFKHGCVVHNPSDTMQNREQFPFNWREDRGIMERICPCGIGHPDSDSARYAERMGHPELNSHGCCGIHCEPTQPSMRRWPKWASRLSQLTLR